MEACGGSPFLGRALQQQGHEVRLIPVKTHKGDYVDAEAVGRPTMCYLPIKRAMTRLGSGGLYFRYLTEQPRAHLFLAP